MRKVLIVFVVFAALAAGIGIYFWTLPTKDTSSLKAEHSVKANELLDAFSADEVAANEVYLGKIIEVSGRVQSVKAENAGLHAVVLEAGSMMGGVVCNMAGANEGYDFNQLSGQEVLIKGECTGYLMDVVLERCVLVNE